MIIDLKGKQALVSGSTAGIGYAIAKGLAAAGAAVVINGRGEGRVKQAVLQLQEEFPANRIDGVAADLSSAEGVAQLVARVPEADILVNNLGIFEPKAFEATTDDDWQRFFDTNVMSGIRLTRHYLAHLKRRNWGRIVFVSSESAINIPSEMIHYGMTKTAELAISRGVAESLAGTGITVNAVLPGPPRSEGVDEFFAKIAREKGKSEGEVAGDSTTTPRPPTLVGA